MLPIFVASNTTTPTDQMKAMFSAATLKRRDFFKISAFLKFVLKSFFKNLNKKNMKKSIFFGLFILATMVISCEKDKTSSIFGEYYGELRQISTGYEEVFTDPNTSTFVFYRDTLITNETVTIAETGDQKFIIDWVFTEFLFPTSSAKDTIDYDFSIGNGYTVEKAQIFINTDKKSLYFQGTSETESFMAPSKLEYLFTGIKI